MEAPGDGLLMYPFLHLGWKDNSPFSHFPIIYFFAPPPPPTHLHITTTAICIPFAFNLNCKKNFPHACSHSENVAFARRVFVPRNNEGRRGRGRGYWCAHGWNLELTNKIIGFSDLTRLVRPAIACYASYQQMSLSLVFVCLRIPGYCRSNILVLNVETSLCEVVIKLGKMIHLVLATN